MQLSEQLPKHVTSQAEPGLHEMLPLGPSVIAQEALSPQSTLQDSPQEPLQVAWLPQDRVQLPPQTLVDTSQL